MRAAAASPLALRSGCDLAGGAELGFSQPLTRAEDQLPDDGGLDAELSCNLVRGVSLQLLEHDRPPLPLWQCGDLLDQCLHPFLALKLLGRLRVCAEVLVQRLVSRVLSAQKIEGSVVCDAIQPGLQLNGAGVS